MHRFFVAADALKDDMVRITGSDFNHISNSLRMQPGEELIINNGDGMDYLAEIREITEEMVIAGIKSSQKNENEPAIEVTLAQAIPKKNNMDLIVQKATEIGIHKIIPVNTNRTIVKLSGKKLARRRERWQKIAEEAAKQSRRGRIPLIAELLDLRKMEEIFQQYDLILIPWEDEKTKGLKEIWQEEVTAEKKIEKVLMLIGPEGGFPAEEVTFVRKYGGRSITLGPRILRTETAGFVTLTAVLYQAGELGG